MRHQARREVKRPWRAALVRSVSTAMVLAIVGLVGSAPAIAGDKHEDDKKVVVCKYVGTPNTDERLQTGNNPIVVSENAIQKNQWDGTVPGWFSDKHDRSFVLAYATDDVTYDVSDCPQPEQPVTPDPTIEYTDWVDGSWECGDTKVVQTRTKTVTPYKAVLTDGQWAAVEDTDNISVITEMQERNLTDHEIESCKPELPDPKVEYTSWADQQWKCDDTEVVQTRTKTVTPYRAVLTDGQWAIVEDGANVTVTTETQSRDLTEAEIENCVTPTPSPSPSTSAPATPANNPAPPKTGGPIHPPVPQASLPPVLAATGPNDYAAGVLGGVAGLAILLGLTLVGVRHWMRRPVPVRVEDQEGEEL